MPVVNHCERDCSAYILLPLSVTCLWVLRLFVVAAAVAFEESYSVHFECAIKYNTVHFVGVDRCLGGVLVEISCFTPEEGADRQIDENQSFSILSPPFIQRVAVHNG
jgi:hypothetical protein